MTFNLHSVVVNVFAFQPSHSGSIHSGVTIAWNGSIRSIDAVCRSGKENARSNLFLLKNLALQLGLGSDASLRDSNYVAAAFSLMKATYCCA